MRIRAFAIIILLLTCSAFAAEKVEPAGSLPESVPAAIRNAVDAKGFRVSADNIPLADLWLRPTVPTGTKHEAGGVLYPDLAPGTFVGVISLPKGLTDFRGQSIAAGYYILRYELLPEDGNHMGVAPNRDFLLLVPLSSDPGPTLQTKYEDLVKLSGKASGTSHPAVLALVQPTAAKEPSAATNADGWVVFSWKMKTASADLPFSLVLKGQGQQ